MSDALTAMRLRVGNLVVPDSVFNGEVIIGEVIADVDNEPGRIMMVRWLSNQRGVFKCFEDVRDVRMVR